MIEEVISRSFFADLLREALTALANKSRNREVFAAPLAGRVKDLLRIRTQDPDINLSGELFGPILYPNYPAFEYPKLKFRQFLQAFPEIAEVFSEGSGDIVRLMEMTPVEQAFNKTEPESHLDPPAPKPPVQLAYLLVDSASFLDQLHHILAGERPNPRTLPNWDQLRKYLQERFPVKDWKCRFFMGVANGPNDGAGSFRSFLESIGFRVIQFDLKNPPSVMDEMVNERSIATGSAVSRLLLEIGNSKQDAHVFTVTHSSVVVDALGDLLRKRNGSLKQIGLIGFPERMDAGLIKLKENGLLVVDIEKDAKVFKAALPRRQTISLNDFNAAEYL